MITCCNLLCGCVAVWLATQEAFAYAFLFILAGAVFDFFDGFAARRLGVSGPLGIQMDSLADDITFGLAPSMMLFCYLLPLIGWWSLISLLMAAFSALRLGKFNIDERQTSSFIGLPTPANALFWGSLIVGGGKHLTHHTYGLLIVLLLIVLSCWILVAEIPLFALKFKHWGWKDNEVKYIFVLSCIPLLAILGVSGLAVIIAWYVVLSLFSNRYRSESAVH